MSNLIPRLQTLNCARWLPMAAVNRRRLLLLLLLQRRCQRRRREQKRIWVRKIFRSRRKQGEYHALIAEMKLRDHESFYKYFHMTPQTFSHLLSRVGPYIKRQDTRLREAIPPDERLAITLRYQMIWLDVYLRFAGKVENDWSSCVPL